MNVNLILDVIGVVVVIGVAVVIVRVERMRR